MKQFEFELKSDTWARAKFLINKLYLIPKNFHSFETCHFSF